MSRYKRISNSPFERKHFLRSWCWMDNVFNDEEITNIEFLTKKNRKLEPGLTFGVRSSEEKNSEELSKSMENMRKNVRRSNVAFVEPTEENIWIFDRFNGLIENLNENFYSFDLNGYSSFQYSEYRADENGTYNWHMDMGLDNISKDKQNDDMRKLSLVMLLNHPGIDFEGGSFYINTSLESNPVEVPMKKGTVILFPSFLLHTVSPVTKGIRKSIVIWVEGPKFR